MKVGHVLGAGALSFAAALGLAFVHPFGNPARTPAPPRSSLPSDSRMSGKARQVLVNKCADCHSDSTHWPIYMHVAPVSWLVERDVMEGRKHMNLSHWLELSSDQREVLSTEIVNQAKKGAMPPVQYQLIHRDAKLTHEDVAALLTLVPEETSVGHAGVGDATRGQTLFQKRCTGCHALDANREGPRLRGVYGRKAGSVDGFTYSAALRGSGRRGSGQVASR